VGTFDFDDEYRGGIMDKKWLKNNQILY